MKTTIATKFAISGAALLLTVSAAGCTEEPEPVDAAEPSPSSPEPQRSEEVDGRPVPTPSVSPEDIEPVDPLPLPESCEAAGLKAHLDEFTDQMAEPDFEEVRTDMRLECSWAGFSRSDWSEVVMVTYAPGESLVDHLGHIPASAASNPDFFITPEVEELGGIAEWRAGQVFSGVALHVPGMQVSITANADVVGDDELLAVATATAGDLLAEEAGDDSEVGGDPGADEDGSEDGAGGEEPAD
ncbi:hypothetical protein HDA32_004511 [Spinactinospora alkalitolerans]|uniref:DUF3558 domain-containing protein n=1 Tax=Spinactinospora alkalitolerans TaxID=687207 RepID=A0A852TZY1_9ACTN|nr:hypothetical protein [Spinactinospora alkalitolerans]NYE49391.1 hypothetical protein [Spinactinospora alkalitolerans]